MFDADLETAADLLLPLKKRLPAGRLYLGDWLNDELAFVSVIVSLFVSLDESLFVSGLELHSFDDFIG